MGSQVSSELQDIHVVVVGGGFGGIIAAQRLKSQNVKFTLIDMRDAFHHNIGALRASVQSGFARRTFIPYAETFGDSFVQGHVERVDTERQTVVLRGGREIQYTHLILCTGTDGPFPGRFNEAASYQTAIEKYEDFIKEIQAADSVLVVGGGSSGVEMAAEVKTAFPTKKVVLIHPKTDLGDPDLLPGVRDQAKQVLLEKGVELLLGEKVRDLHQLQLNTTQKDMEVTTEGGTKLHTDLIICCTGLRVNTLAYKSTLSSSMAEDGALRVNQHMQVEGFSNIFAAGDCANVNEPKMAYHAALHAEVAAANVINSISGRKLTTYQTGNITMVMAMGWNDGVGQFNGFQLPRFLVTFFKSRSLLVWKSWWDMNQKEH
ncbi:ferroptosis suppressor protein 1 [Salarias fasciatus]|uniref:Ferroptosis suppressor protein 1 n=1 Tax=Salarias fasciatus TaxID=181472 RepID=A0A672GFP7_SALFA|nr:apoptosis-inducing factor 2 [Salarias fasciatus]